MKQLLNDSNINSDDLDMVFKQMDLIGEQQSKLDVITISKYADMSIDEFAAEAFADTLLGSSPSKYSLEVKEVIDKYFGKKNHPF